MKLNVRKVELARARACKSPRDLEKAGIPRGTWTAARSGKSVRPETAGRIAKALGVDVTEILEDESRRNDGKNDTYTGNPEEMP